MTWNPETEASLRKWVGEGYSFGQISKKMQIEHRVSLSRNACIGKASRLGLGSPVEKKPVLRSGQKKPVQYKPRRVSNRTHDGHMPLSTKATTPFPIPPQPIVEVVFDAPHGAARAVTALHADQCKYPIGEPTDPDFHFCHAKAKDGSVYCEAHHKRCTQPYDSKRRGIQRGVDRRSGAMEGWA